MPSRQLDVRNLQNETKLALLALNGDILLAQAADQLANARFRNLWSERAVLVTRILLAQLPIGSFFHPSFNTENASNTLPKNVVPTTSRCP
jgi:hypothetical protein